MDNYEKNTSKNIEYVSAGNLSLESFFIEYFKKAQKKLVYIGNISFICQLYWK